MLVLINTWCAAFKAFARGIHPQAGGMFGMIDDDGVAKRNLFLKPNFLRLFGVKRRMAVFHQCRFPRLGRQETEKTKNYRGAENRAALNSNKQPPSVQLPPALRATRAA